MPPTALAGLSPSVANAVRQIGEKESVTATRIAAEILRLHPEYGASRGGRVASTLAASHGDPRPVPEWVDLVRKALKIEQPVLHGKLFIVALARLDDDLGRQLSVDGWLATLESELDEPVETLFGVASDTVAGGADRVVQLHASATADLPAIEDTLGFAPLVTALRALLDDPETRLPLAIAITGKWGAGKSSVMRQLEQQLRFPPTGSTRQRRWTTVRFDAWKYERSERLWAALAKAVYDQALEGMGRIAGLRFRIRLEWARLTPWRFFLRFVSPVFAAAAAVLGFLAADFDSSGDAAVAAGTAAAVSAGVTRYWRAIIDPFKAALDRHASRPDYEAQLGFTSEADRDIACLAQTIAPTDSHALAVFVDDLDRCSSAHLVDVVEAMNQIFNSDIRQAAEGGPSGHRCVFILGLDREVVSTTIEVAYRETVERLRALRSPLAADFGFQFLAKLVQLSVGVPRPSKTALDGLLTRLSTAGGDRASIAAAAAARVKKIQDAQVVADAERASLPHLEDNPRQVKRFHNVFRLQVYIAAAQEVFFTPEQLRALGRWVALRLRWPALADDLDHEPALLRILDDAVNQEQIPELTGELERYLDWIENERVKDVLRVSRDIDELHVSRLPLHDFLPVA